MAKMLSALVVFVGLAGSLAGGARVAAAGPRPPGGSGTMNANLTMGRKWFSDKAGWQGFANHNEWGLRFDYRYPTWPVAIAVDFSQSVERRDGTIFDEDGKELTGHIRAQTLEGNFGVRKIWGEARRGPHTCLGGGLTLIRSLLAKSEKPDLFRGSPFAWSFPDDEGSAGIGTGFWANAGVYWTFDAMRLGYEWLNVGLDTRYSWAKGPLFGERVQFGGYHAALLAGVRW